MKPAAFHRTNYVGLSTFDLGLQISSDALRVENMATLQDSKFVPVDFGQANRAFPALGVGALCLPFIFGCFLLQELFEGQLILPVLFLDLGLVDPFFIDEVWVD